MTKSKKDMRREAVRKYPATFALNCAIRRALKQATVFEQGGPGLIILVAPENAIFENFVRAAIAELFVGDEEDFRNSDHGYMRVPKGAKPKSVDKEFDTECQDKARAFVLAESREALTPTILLAADFIVDVAPVTERDCVAAFKVALKVDLTEEQAREALSFPQKDLWTAARVGRPIGEVLRRLRNASSPKPKIDLDSIPRVEEMHGYGAARDWALQLRDDLKDWAEGTLPWADVDKGLLLSGPPGTGKTTFAAAIAKTCNVHLVATSLGQWQAKGHLGETLREMRSDFQTAKDNAPSILFIDEIDSVGDRSTFTADHKNYSIQVVNALLECIDGVEGREGVIVIGSTNNPQLLDAAVRRAGRLDKHVIIGLPDADSRVAIVRQHLGEELSLQELHPIRAFTHGFSGADLSKLARDARRTARLQKRRVCIEDLTENLPKRLAIKGAYRETVAFHEAGHTIVGYRLEYGEFLGTQIADSVPEEGQIATAGGAMFRMEPIAVRNRQTYLDKIATGLAGIAAEMHKLGSFNDGSSVGKGSDLEQVTRLAVFIEAQAGMGNTFRYASVEGNGDFDRMLHGDPVLRAAVDAILKEQFQRAIEILQADSDLLDLIAAELNSEGVLRPARLEELLADVEQSRGRKRRRRS